MGGQAAGDGFYDREVAIANRHLSRPRKLFPGVDIVDHHVRAETAPVDPGSHVRFERFQGFGAVKGQTARRRIVKQPLPSITHQLQRNALGVSGKRIGVER